MSVDSAINEARSKMENSISHLEAALSKIRTGKANPAMLDGVMVEYYGSQVPLNQVSTINTPDARTLQVQPFEKNSLPDIERAIINSNLGLNPQNDGDLIRISVPPLTEERRKEFVKMAKAEGEDTKVSIRNARRDAIEAIKKLQKDGLAEDAAKDAETKADNVSKDFVTKVDEYVNKKEKEIMTV